MERIVLFDQRNEKMRKAKAKKNRDRVLISKEEIQRFGIKPENLDFVKT